MAAARGFVHVNSRGYVEPCPFSHLTSDSIRDVSLREALQSPFFRYIREHPELLEKPRMGCALFERRKELKKIAKELNASPTD